MDLVFNPLFLGDSNIWENECGRIEEDKGKKKINNGIVYNEMKAIFANPNQVLKYIINKSVFEDTTYGKVYGGKPEEMNNMDLKDIIKKYKQYYRASNAVICIQGDIDVTRELEDLDNRYLSYLKNGFTNKNIVLIGRRDLTKQIENNYIRGEKSIVSINYLCETFKDATEMYAFEALLRYIFKLDNGPFIKWMEENYYIITCVI
ncbi:MAG: insulinase family protein [Lachnospiraceae bacterium]|nr:insulinase family protein [Lachnospiraceae bacterium]